MQVPNFWPSVSRTIGDYLPGRYIYRITISITVFPRVMDAVLYYNFFAARRPMLFKQKWWYRWLNRFYLLSITIELFLFYTLAFISSQEHLGKFEINMCMYMKLNLKCISINACTHRYPYISLECISRLLLVAHGHFFDPVWLSHWSKAANKIGIIYYDKTSESKAYSDPCPCIVYSVNCYFTFGILLQERKSMKVRCVLLVVHVLAVMSFFYYAIMHIQHCQPYGILFFNLEFNKISK